jgi:hypothetical protein
MPAWLVLMPTAALAGLEDGRAFFDLGRWDRAMGELRPLAEAGDPAAQFLVATMLDEGGHGVRADRRAALGWYHAAGEQGHVSAQYALFLHYSVTPGPGNERQEKAMAWARRIAERGPTLAGHDRLQAAMAAESLGLYHGRGLAAEPDRPQAYLWLAVAERLGRSEAAPALAALRQAMEPAAAAAAAAAAERWWQAHAAP